MSDNILGFLVCFILPIVPFIILFILLFKERHNDPYGFR